MKRSNSSIICTVTNDLSHDQRMMRICTSLARAGYEVELVGRQLPNSPTLTQQSYRQTRLQCRFHKGKLFYLEYNLRLFFYLLRSKAQIINAIDLDTLSAAWLASVSKRGSVCVLDAHEYYTETPEVVRRPIVQKVWEAVARFIIPRLRHCYTVGPALAKLFQERYGVPFGVVRNVPNASPPATLPARPFPNGGPKIILYQGMLNEGRGLEAAIAAMPMLPPDAELWLAGHGDILPALQQQVLRLELAHRVRFLGFVPPAQLPALTAKAYIGLNLLENSGLSYYYSLANKAFDYIQSGLPSIQMDFPEYRALNETHGCFHLLPNLSPEVLAQALQTLFQDHSYYQQVHRNCLTAAKTLHWEAEETQLLEIYRKASRR